MTDSGDAFAAEIFIEEEHGRFVVYLQVHFWEGASEDKLTTYSHRVQDYPTRRAAEIAARWIKSAANRDLKYPPLGR
ncbi:MAG: AP2 domain-containing protein [Anaerolineae bacterium]